MSKVDILIINKTIDALELGRVSELNTELTSEQVKHLLWYIKALETEVGIRGQEEARIKKF
jgi:hypothetical protein